jgi:hypothetical protein
MIHVIKTIHKLENFCEAYVRKISNEQIGSKKSIGDGISFRAMAFGVR